MFKTQMTEGLQCGYNYGPSSLRSNSLDMEVNTLLPWDLRPSSGTHERRKAFVKVKLLPRALAQSPSK